MIDPRDPGAPILLVPRLPSGSPDDPVAAVGHLNLSGVLRSTTIGWRQQCHQDEMVARGEDDDDDDAADHRGLETMGGDGGVCQ